MHRPLRRLDDGSLRSGILQIPSGWSSGGNTQLKQRFQLYVLSGSLRIGDRTYNKDTYICHHDGLVLAEFGSGEGPQGGAEVLIVCDGPPAFELTPEPAGTLAIVVEDVPSKGTTQLWEDPRSGATMSHLQVPPGWTSEGPEYHPCQEEIFCLTGDIAPDRLRILKPGWFLWNPAYGVHGYDLHSTAGGTVLEWHDGPWAKVIYEG